MADIDTSNDFLVGVNVVGTVRILRPPGNMSKSEALRLAAWLVALTDPLCDEFPKVFEAVLSS